MPSSLRVLVVEDQPLIALDLEDLLISRGYGVLGPEATVAGALKNLERQTPHAAIVDLDLGGETSFAVGEALLARGIPFVFATGSRGSDGVPAALASVPFILKPFDVDQIFAFLEGI